MYHGDANERQCSHLHMVRKEGKGKAADNQTTSSDLQIYGQPFSSRAMATANSQEWFDGC